MELLGELLGMFRGVEMPEEAPLMTFWSSTKRKVWTRGQATHCLRTGLPCVAEEWGQQRRGREAVRLIPEEFALHSGRIGAATKLAAEGVSDAVIQREGRSGSYAFMRYATANMERPVWVSEVLVERGGCDRQLGRGTRWEE